MTNIVIFILCSSIRSKEAFADPSRDESLIFELLELKSEVEDVGSAAWFLRDLAREQDAEDSIVSTEYMFYRQCFYVSIMTTLLFPFPTHWLPHEVQSVETSLQSVESCLYWENIFLI